MKDHNAHLFAHIWQWKLHIVPSSTTQITLSSFGNDSPLSQTLRLATIQIQTLTGDLIPISVLIVLKIATPIQNSCQIDLDNLPYLRGLNLRTRNRWWWISSFYLNWSWSLLVTCRGPQYQREWSYSTTIPTQVPSIWTLIITSYPIAYIYPNSTYNYSWGYWPATTVVNRSCWYRPSSNFLKSYQSSSISQLPNGTYTAKFPWKDDKSHLTSNYSIIEELQTYSTG